LIEWLGYMDERGYLYLVDRKQDMIITGGYNVYAIEVENCLNSHPAIQNSAVVGIPHEIWGQEVCAMVSNYMCHDIWELICIRIYKENSDVAVKKN